MLSMVGSAVPDVLDASNEPADHNGQVAVPADCYEDALAPARGFALGVALGAAMWCGMGLLLWFLL
jgi:hypothetical protein